MAQQNAEEAYTMIDNVRRLNLMRAGIRYTQWFEDNEDYKRWEAEINTGLQDICKEENFADINETLEEVFDLIFETEKISLFGSCVKFCKSQLDEIKFLGYNPTDKDREYFNPDTINRLYVIYLCPKIRHILTWYINKGAYYIVKDLRKSKRLDFKEVFI